MNWLSEKKWMLGCIVMAMIIIFLALNSVALNKQIDELKREYVWNISVEWRQLYHLSEIIDQQYIKNDFQNPSRYRLFVNQVTHNFTGRSVDMRNLLVLTYDPLFTDLTEDPLDKEEASKLLKDMNDDIMFISRSIVDMPDDKKEKLLERTSTEFIELSTQVKAANNKHSKLVDDYFRKNKNKLQDH